jgi:hypothetical protein
MPFCFFRPDDGAFGRIDRVDPSDMGRGVLRPYT